MMEMAIVALAPTVAELALASWRCGPDCCSLVYDKYRRAEYADSWKHCSHIDSRDQCDCVLSETIGRYLSHGIE